MRPLSLPAVLAASVVGATVCASAQAAAPWSEPGRVPGSSKVNGAAALSFSPSGHGLATWLTGGGGVPGVATTRGAVAEPGTRLGTGRVLARSFAFGGAGGGVVLYGRDRLLAIGLVPEGRGMRLAAATGRVGGGLDRPRRLLPDVAPGSYAIASNEAGDTVVARHALFRSRRPSCRRAVYLTVRPAGGRFGSPQSFCAGGQAADVAVAINSRREVLVAWEYVSRPSGRPGAIARRVHARLRTARGRLGAVQALGGADDAEISAALGNSGQAIVSWTNHDEEDDRPQAAATMNVAVAPRGGRFSGAQELERIEAAGGIAGPVRLALPLADKPVLAWTGHRDGLAIVRVAEVESNGSVTVAQTVSPADTNSLLADLVSGSRGEVLAVWTDRGAELARPDPPALRAAARPPATTAFGPVEEIASRGERHFPTVKFEPGSGRVIAVWTELPTSGRFVGTATRLPIAPQTRP